MAHVRELIVAGEVGRGEYLRLDHLAGGLGVSVTPVREAMMQLRSEGLVEWRPRRGFVARPPSAGEISDVYAVQAYVAAELARRATRRLSAVDVDALEEVQEALEAANERNDLDELEHRNHDFHRRLNLAAGSPRLAWVLQSLTHFAPRRFFARIEGWPDASASDHRAVIAALRAGDPEGTADAMGAHIRRAGELLSDHVEQRQGGERG
ncbi:GntR family transcriptional regulator [Nocardioides hungaricus]